MVNATIGDQIDGSALRTREAKVLFEQAGITYKDTDRPNPAGQINIKNETQLQAELGTTQEVGVEEIVHISFDEDATYTKPILLASLAGIDIQKRVGVTINYTGPGAFIQLKTTGVPALFVYTLNLNVIGNNTNSLINVEIIGFGFVTMIGFSLQDLISIGTIKSPAISISRPSGFNVKQGLIIINPVQAFLDTKVMGNFSSTNTTWITVITTVVGTISFTNLNASNVVSGDSLVYFDPNAPPGNIFRIQGSRISINTAKGIFYQEGTNIVINSVTNLGGGVIRFTTAVSHNLVVGKAFTTNGFGIETAYNNKTYVPIAVDTPLTGTTVDVVGVFTDTDTGNLNASSLNQKNKLVRAKGNINSPDSKVDGSAFVNGNAVVTTIVSPDVFQDLNFGTLLASVNIERFTLVNAVNGEFRYDGVDEAAPPIIQSITLRKDSGSTANYSIKWIKDDGGGYANLDDNIILPFEAKTTNIGGTYVGESILNEGDLLKPQISGIGTTDGIIVDSTSISIKV